MLLLAAIAAVSLLYSSVGQAGGTAFLAAMAFGGLPIDGLRPTALLLNIIVAGYATFRLHRRGEFNQHYLWPLLFPSLATALVGGLIALPGTSYRIVTGLLLVVAAALMLARKPPAPDVAPSLSSPRGVALAGAVAGLLSGLTGIGGGVFIAPIVIALGWCTPQQATAVSPPFIFGNSVVGLLGVLLSGQTPLRETPSYGAAAFLGAIVGTWIASRKLPNAVIKVGLAVIILAAGFRLLAASS